MEHLPAIMDEYRREQRNDSRLDASRNLEDKVRQELQKVAEELEQKLAAFGLDGLVQKIAKLTKTNSLREWKRVCKDTLGIDLMDDYYNGDFYEEALHRWVDENINKIKGIPNETLGSMREIILDGFKKGRTVTDISKKIQQAYGVTRRKAQALARDQVGSLNAQISKLQQKDAGCTKYRWSSSKDSRVRHCHRALDGKIFDWDDPPEMWYETKSGRVYTGRHCHPGEDYLCRCVAIPVFDYDTVNVPMQKSDKKG
ncbi:minor capsid protein [Anaerotruncus colihominis]|uniref:phage head morphogenesis protein n=1 Tax=Anaerotruncus colihominis TaxID=169435 RepID=UPI00242F9B7B|nr:minor capsid protein [Anaerotruncus colihominis]